MSDEVTEVPTPVVETPPAAPVNPGPWSADLAKYITDPNALEAADRYMREVQQPRMTQLETDTANARALIEDFQRDPVATMNAVAEELWEDDPERVRAIAAALGMTIEEDPPVEPTEPAAPVITPEMQEAIDFAREQKNAQAYAELTEWAKEQIGEEDWDDANFAQHVMIHEGDGEKSVASYREFLAREEAKYKARFGVEDPPAAVDTTPNVVGSRGTTTAPSSTSREHTMESAMDEYLAEVKAAMSPTPVGSV